MQTRVRSMEEKTTEEKEMEMKTKPPPPAASVTTRATVYNRCEDVLCAAPPAAPRTRMRGLDNFGAHVHSSSDGGGA